MIDSGTFPSGITHESTELSVTGYRIETVAGFGSMVGSIACMGDEALAMAVPARVGVNSAAFALVTHVAANDQAASWRPKQAYQASFTAA